MKDVINSYSEILPKLAEKLVGNGSLALILLDISHFCVIEEQYGSQTYTMVCGRLFDLIVEQAGREYRREDIVVMEEPGGLSILLFLSPRRDNTHILYEHLESLRIRLKDLLIPKLLRTAFPYLKNAPHIPMGYALGIHNSLLDPRRIILRSIQDARENAEWKYRTEEMESKQQLTELIVNEQIVTLFQPIVGIGDGKPVAYEALSRGASKIKFRSADNLFDAAIRHHLLVELDRLCRKQALACSHRLPEKAKIFINALPATMMDPEFQGQHLIKALEQAKITPDRIVIEITEKLAIDNLGLFQEDMHYYTSLGMSLAVDDVGAGYSGLETISKLKPNYLKVDMALVQGVHTSMVNLEILKGILLLGRAMGAQVIAEGIEKVEELEILREIGIELGQGFLFGKPSSM
jgi:EAL domain-containing protein (putative c-di-GMP-specific phosphodiesterase class I)